MKRIYISLPISGYDLEERKGYAQRVESALSASYEVVNPLKNGIPETEDWCIHMRKDISDLLTCDFIFMCSGHKLSRGCRLELDIAKSCGIGVIYEESEVDYTSFLCKECRFFYYDVFANARCSHPARPGSLTYTYRIACVDFKEG